MDIQNQKHAFAQAFNRRFTIGFGKLYRAKDLLSKNPEEVSLDDPEVLREAAKELTRKQIVDYLQWLGWEDDNAETIFRCVESTTAERLEAILRAVGKWEE